MVSQWSQLRGQSIVSSNEEPWFPLFSFCTMKCANVLNGTWPLVAEIKQIYFTNYTQVETTQFICASSQCCQRTSTLQIHSHFVTQTDEQKLSENDHLPMTQSLSNLEVVVTLGYNLQELLIQMDLAVHIIWCQISQISAFSVQ